MSLTKKVKCVWCRDGVLANEHQRKYLQSCPFCHGTGEQEMNVHLHHYEGKFEDTYEKVSNYRDDMWMGFNCPCGEEMSIIDEAEVCKCGRIYRPIYRVEVDETHIGDIDWLIQESNKHEIGLA